MRAYWIVPNRDQSDDVLASDGETMRPLRDVLDPGLRPEGFSHGVPAELLEKSEPGAYAQILFAQRFPNWNGDKQLFTVTTPAGVDASDRVVHLGQLFILEPGERPRFEISDANLSKADKAYAKALVQRLTAGTDVWAQSVRELSELQSERRRTTNVALDRSAVRFHSLYALAPDGSLKKTASKRRAWKRAGAVLILFVLSLAGGLLHARCFRPMR